MESSKRGARGVEKSRNSLFLFYSQNFLTIYLTIYKHLRPIEILFIFREFFYTNKNIFLFSNDDTFSISYSKAECERSRVTHKFKYSRIILLCKITQTPQKRIVFECVRLYCAWVKKKTNSALTSSYDILSKFLNKRIQQHSTLFHRQVVINSENYKVCQKTFLDSERSDECIDFTMIITSRNNASISNFGGGFRWKSEYPWCIIEFKFLRNLSKTRKFAIIEQLKTYLTLQKKKD
ncbi:hypothetical protein AGLY_011551 [Aphis glycines]|uniref:Uncharacterized protein n=1 Tax=Aphis glycines TaxID=307491 RepID=A0A6G0TD70_APHGL|nr:hypothetical protein AGLY_011551 [Aphis glycines]